MSAWCCVKAASLSPQLRCCILGLGALTWWQMCSLVVAFNHLALLISTTSSAFCEYVLHQVFWDDNEIKGDAASVNYSCFFLSIQGRRDHVEPYSVFLAKLFCCSFIFTQKCSSSRIYLCDTTCDLGLLLVVYWEEITGSWGKMSYFHFATGLG